jgi:HPt (histidine-containing phosphotransfer) domain-containing protein
MSWNDFWKKQDEKDYEEFLMNPKETFEQLQTKFKEMDGTIQSQAIDITTTRTELVETIATHAHQVKDYENTIRYTEQDRDRNHRLYNGAKNLGQTKIEQLKVEYIELENDLRIKLEDEYKTKWARKEADLEKAYNHEVHIFVEEQQDKMNALVPAIVREAIVGFYNETRTQTN